MTLPDFVIAGAQKCGSTRLHNLLRVHPQLFLPRRPQELHYFDLHYDRGPAWFESHFRKAGAGQRVGQTSPLYLFHPEAPGRMARDLPQSRLVFVLRDPVRRAYSHYWHQVKKGSESEPFERALELEQTRLRGSEADRRRYSYVARGRYLEQLQRFGAWPAEATHIVLFEDLIADPVAVVDSLCAFLGVDSEGSHCVADARHQSNRAALPRSKRVQRRVRRLRGRFPRLARAVELLNLRTVQYPPMSSRTEAQLYRLFDAPNRELAERFKLDLSGWRGPVG